MKKNCRTCEEKRKAVRRCHKWNCLHGKKNYCCSYKRQGNEGVKDDSNNYGSVALIEKYGIVESVPNKTS